MIIDGKNILITGSSQGLGAQLAIAFAGLGAHVFVNYAHSKEKAEAVVREIKSSGGNVDIIKCDVANITEIENMLSQLDEHGGVDILINNARIDPYKRRNDCNDSEWFDQVIGVNLKGPYLCSLMAIEQMKRKGSGKIINLSSVWAYRAANKQLLEYAMSKAAMHSLTRSLALVSAEYGITVNTVAPGMIVSDEMTERVGEDKLDGIIQGIPLKRGGAPAEMADAIRFVIENDYLTGETININGGTYMP